MAVTKALIDKYLTGASKMITPEGFIGEGLLPVIKVKQNSGKLAGYGTDHLRILNVVMGGRGKAPRFSNMTRSSDSYFIENHGLEGMVTKDDFDNVEDPYDAREDEMIGLVTVLKLSREKALADNFTSTSVMTSNETLSGISQFSDYVNSDPLSKFKTAQESVYDSTGVAPDTAVMSWKVANTLVYHPGILDALGFTQNRAGTLTERELAQAMKVQNIKVGAPKYESANLGQTSSLADVWGKDIVFCKLPAVAQKHQVSLGYTVRKGNESPYETSRWQMNNPRGAEGILVTDNYDDLLSNVGAAYLIKDAIA